MSDREAMKAALEALGWAHTFFDECDLERSFNPPTAAVGRDALSKCASAITALRARLRCPVCNGNDADMPCAYPSEGKPGCLRDKRLAQADEPVAVGVTGAIVNGRIFADRLEQYGFECEAGDIRLCSDWIEFRRCFEWLAEHADASPPPQQQRPEPVTLYVECSNLPGPDIQFYDIVTADGRSLSVGEWSEQPDGTARLGPLYASPPQRPPLSEEEIEDAIGDSDGRWHDGEFRIDGPGLTKLLRAIERKVRS